MKTDAAINDNASVTLTMQHARDPEKGFRLLLCAGLWHDASFLDGFPSLDEKRWQELARIASSTGTAGIVADGIELYAQNTPVPKSIVMKFMGLKVRLMQKHVKHNLTIAKIFRMLSDMGFEGRLLKGQGAAANYDNPESRGCGDIDIFIGEEHLDTLIGKLKDRGITCDEEIDDNMKHAVFIYEDLGVELHRHALFVSRPKANSIFSEWWKEGFLKSPDHIYLSSDGRLSPTPAEGYAAIPVMPPTHQAFMLYYHLLAHFKGMQITFRQVCDVARFFFKHHEEIDTEEFRNILTETKTLKAWHAFATFFHLWLGMPKECLPLYEDGHEKLAAKILERFRKKCFYPQKKRWKRPSGRLASKFYTYVNDWGSAMEMSRIFPEDTLWWLYDTTTRGVRNIFNKANRGGASARAEHYIQRHTNDSNP